VLTALELTGLDLRGTELVVLSACDTAVGAVETGEGVLGLRRALVLAGAESSVMSLWKVDDDATRELMVSFYGKLLRDGLGRAEALRRAQLEIAEQPRWRHPAYWASFVLSGSFAPLGAADAAGGDAGQLGAAPSTPPSVHPASASGCGCRVEASTSGARGAGNVLLWFALGFGAVLTRRCRQSAPRDWPVRAAVATFPLVTRASRERPTRSTRWRRRRAVRLSDVTSTERRRAGTRIPGG
jgi:hypothetical protein